MMMFDELESVVIESLMEDIDTYIKMGGCDHQDLEVVQSALTLLRYYMRSETYQQWYAQKGSSIEKLFCDNSEENVRAEVINIKDKPDGSADIEFAMDDDMRDIVISEGMNMLLIKGILGCSTDELFDIAKEAHGGDKDAIEKDCIVKGCPNKSTQGGFVGDLCSPCHKMLSEGKIGPSQAWFAKENLEMRKKLERISNVL